MRALSTLACLRCNRMDPVGVRGQMTWPSWTNKNKWPARVVELTAYQSEDWGQGGRILRWWCRLHPKYIGHTYSVHRTTNELVDNYDCGSGHCELAVAIIRVFGQVAVIFGRERKTVKTQKYSYAWKSKWSKTSKFITFDAEKENENKFRYTSNGKRRKRWIDCVKDGNKKVT